MGNLPSGSAIPSALTALMSIAASALPSGTSVYFGPEVTAYTAPLTFHVSEITGDQVPAEIGPQYRREETFSFVCSLIVYTGGAPDASNGFFVQQLNDLMASFVLLSRAIANNPWLSPDGTQANGVVRFAEVGNFDINPDTDANGESATTLDFSIRCQARVTSLT